MDCLVPANGDTSTHFYFDSGMIGCERKDIAPDAVTPITNIDASESKHFQYAEARNRLTKNIAALMEIEILKANKSSEFIDSLGPEDYC
jgi:hypothetical protein